METGLYPVNELHVTKYSSFSLIISASGNNSYTRATNSGIKQVNQLTTAITLNTS